MERAWLSLVSEVGHREVAISLDPASRLRLPLDLWEQDVLGVLGMVGAVEPAQL